MTYNSYTKNVPDYYKNRDKKVVRVTTPSRQPKHKHYTMDASQSERTLEVFLIKTKFLWYVEFYIKSIHH